MYWRSIRAHPQRSTLTSGIGQPLSNLSSYSLFLVDPGSPSSPLKGTLFGMAHLSTCSYLPLLGSNLEEGQSNPHAVSFIPSRTGRQNGIPLSSEGRPQAPSFRPIGFLSYMEIGKLGILSVKSAHSDHFLAPCCSVPQRQDSARRSDPSFLLRMPWPASIYFCSGIHSLIPARHF